MLRSILILTLLIPLRAIAEEPAPPDLKPIDPNATVESPGFRWNTAALFAAGAATAFVAHESCHILGNLAFGSTPHLEPVSFMGVIPFFAVAPDVRCSQGRCTTQNGRPFSHAALFTIVSAGIQCQHYENEFILTRTPRLRYEEAPFRKGMLTFNTLMSVSYVLANWIGVEPESGDLRAIYRDTGAPRHLMNILVLAAAGFDIARYFFPDVAWLAWVSRTAKVTTTGIVFTL